MIRTKSTRIGDMVRVYHCYGGHLLPEGLPEGSDVQVVGVVQTYRLVEWESQLFEVSMGNIAPVFEAVSIC